MRNRLRVMVLHNDDNEDVVQQLVKRLRENAKIIEVQVQKMSDMIIFPEDLVNVFPVYDIVIVTVSRRRHFLDLLNYSTDRLNQYWIGLGEFKNRHFSELPNYLQIDFQDVDATFASIMSYLQDKV